MRPIHSFHAFEMTIDMQYRFKWFEVWKARFTLNSTSTVWSRLWLIDQCWVFALLLLTCGLGPITSQEMNIPMRMCVCGHAACMCVYICMCRFMRVCVCVYPSWHMASKRIVVTNSHNLITSTTGFGKEDEHPILQAVLPPWHEQTMGGPQSISADPESPLWCIWDSSLHPHVKCMENWSVMYR